MSNKQIVTLRRYEAQLWRKTTNILKDKLDTSPSELYSYCSKITNYIVHTVLNCDAHDIVKSRFDPTSPTGGVLTTSKRIATPTNIRYCVLTNAKNYMTDAELQGLIVRRRILNKTLMLTSKENILKFIYTLPYDESVRGAVMEEIREYVHTHGLM